MRKRVFFSVRIIILGLFISGVPAGLALQKTKLPDVYRKWLEEEVVYLIKPVERDVFLKLQSDRERNLFIEAFWKQRDPTPGTPENEFKTEHARRINHVNKYFGRSSPLPGWRTDRGRMYIILGEPNDTQHFDGRGNIYPTEIWFYQDKAPMGLPAGFYLVFFQEGGTGDFKLYSPSKDGPQALLTAYTGDPSDYDGAYKSLLEIEPNVANVSLSLIPGESDTGFGRPSMASDMMLQKAEGAAQAQVQGSYAQKFLQYKDVVEVEYSANYFDSDALVKLVKDPSGIYFVHYAVEPKRLSVNEYEGKYSTTLKLIGRVTTPEGTMIHQFEKPVALSLDESRMKMADVQPLNVQDMFPLIPGTYRLSILLKNESSKEFTSFEQTILVPGETAAVQMTSPILGFRTAPADPAKRRLKPFQVGATQIYCQPGRVFTRADKLAVAFQVFGLPPALRETASIKFVFSMNDKAAFEKSRPFVEYLDAPDIVEEFPLADFVPAHYNLNVSVVAEGREIVAGREEFDVSHQQAVARPWFFSKLMPEAGDPLYDQLIGTQLLNSGRLAEAKAALEKAWDRKSDDPDLALALARTYLNLEEPAAVPPILAAFLDPARPPNYEIYSLAGQARLRVGEFGEALKIFDAAVSHFGVNAALLRAIGDCHAGLNRVADALAAWEKSLQLNPDQPDLKKKIDALKEKK
jgi:GWxTD domain-containing protein